jgi:16S rRNA (guanine(966)-N(2))-methyltransferase RsmD
LRPTAARVRDALFNSLGPAARGGAVLDLFAGSGALGLEALRRGAERIVFVEHDPQRARALAERVDREGVASSTMVLRLDAYAACRRLASDGVVFALILLDPPYGGGRLTRAVAAVVPVLAPDGTIVAEGHWRDRPELPPGLVVTREARYGETVLWFIRPAASQDPGRGGSHGADRDLSR